MHFGGDLKDILSTQTHTKICAVKVTVYLAFPININLLTLSYSLQEC